MDVALNAGCFYDSAVHASWINGELCHWFMKYFWVERTVQTDPNCTNMSWLSFFSRAISPKPRPQWPPASINVHLYSLHSMPEYVLVLLCIFIILYYISFYIIILYYIIIYCIILYHIILYYIISYYIISYYIILYYIVLYCIVLYCIVLYYDNIYNNVYLAHTPPIWVHSW